MSGTTTCLWCGHVVRDQVDLAVHFENGRCRLRAPRVDGEIIEGRDGVIRVKPAKPEPGTAR